MGWPKASLSLTLLVCLHLSCGKNSEDGQFLLRGQPRAAEDDIACSQLHTAGARPCVKSSSITTLKPGEAYVVDDFLNSSDLKLLHTIYSGITTFSEAEAFKSKWMEKRQLPSSLGLDDEMEKVLHRVTGHANAHLRSESRLEHESWAWNGEYFMDHWQLRSYNRSRKLDPHIDTGLFGRCLSATLHLSSADSNIGTTVKGGDFKTFRCRTEDCFGYGWQYDQRLPEVIVPTSPRRLETLATVSYKPGRLVYFLAETVHGVDAVTKGDRNVLFMWHSCSPTLVNGAARNGHISNVRYLVERRADVNDVLPETGLNPASVAADSGHSHVLEFLLQKGADAEVPDNNGVLPIHRAARAGHLSSVEVLAKAGVDLSTPDRAGSSALIHAVEGGHAAITRRLAQTTGGFGPNELALAEQAVTYGHCPVVQLLSEEGGLDVRTSAAGDNLPLMHRASALGHSTVVECLANLGAEVGAPDSNRGSPPLHPAAAAGGLDVAQVLLARRAEATSADFQGTTALHYAAEEGHLEMITLLLDAAQSRKDAVEAQDDEGLTPRQRAERSGQVDAAKLLGKARKRKRRKKGLDEL